MQDFKFFLCKCGLYVYVSLFPCVFESPPDEMLLQDLAAFGQAVQFSTSSGARAGANLHLFLLLQGARSEEPNEETKKWNSRTKGGDNEEHQNNLTGFRETYLTARLFLAS